MNLIKLNENWRFQEVFPKISAYTTSYNCIKNGYPLIDAIKSFFWCDEIIVADGGSTDTTKQELEELAQLLEFKDKLKVYDFPIDWENPGKDGQLKAMSRAMVMNEYCIQFDADELCLTSPDIWKKYIKRMPDNIPIWNCAVFEPFGKKNTLRLNDSHNPIKWRIYRNLPEISHAIPSYDRLEKDEKIYSKGGSDGCFPVHIVNNQLFDGENVDIRLNQLISLRKEKKYEEYRDLMLQLAKETPTVLHLGHINLTQKINLYLNEWHKWWCELYGKDANDPNNNQYFPGIKPEDVNPTMINQKVRELIENTPVIEYEP